ncbi:SID1 transmembrane family member 1-like [Paramacrobiotus metropolitanus]|uniref:SID1 transmembrane family member 1-like n=1 Tax=Paramacrobiotus metropolitanus TaxID=2943436 RepID=UPI00244656F0|nr:SID1 transmembrane family member 1-like [Paramacrobiotus metropolitanus]
MKKYLICLSVVVYYFFLVSWLLSVAATASSALSRLAQNTKEIDGNFGQEYSGQVNADATDIYHFNYTRLENETDAIRVLVSSRNAVEKYPLLVVIKQQLGVLSWQIPLLAERIYPYWHTGRTLCPTINYRAEDANSSLSNATVQQNIYMEISSASMNSTQYTLTASPVRDFFINRTQPLYLNVTPSMPQYVEYLMPEGIDRVLVQMRALEPQKYCSYFSVQPVQCPVADLESELRIEGIYQTVTSKGAIVVTRSQYSRFYVVITVKPVDFFCHAMEDIQPTINSSSAYYDRVKQVELLIIPTLDTRGYLLAIFAMVGFFLGFYVITCGLLAGNILHGRCTRSPATGGSKVLNELEKDVEGEPIPRPEGAEPALRGKSGHDDATVEEQPGGSRDEAVGNDDDSEVIRRASDSSLESLDVDFVQEVEDDKNIIRSKGQLCVGDLTRKTRKRLSKKDRQYRWSMITICIFYGLPVAQLVVTSQRALHDTGNEDLCYYNFACSNPVGMVVDFNHVISNLGYVLLGILFILLVRRRQRQRSAARHANPPAKGDVENGVPAQFELYYATGLALMMEGLMSASYHICPSYSNFQFDTSFMYLIAGLGMLKIYQNRHADVLPNAYMAYAFFAFIILVAMLGVVYASIYVWITFSVALIIVSCMLSAQIYFIGRWKLDCGMFGRIWLHWRTHGVISRPGHVDRFVLLLMVIVINWTLAIMGPLWQPMDFASYMLACFLANLMLYLLFYSIMKLFHGERISRLTILFALGALLGWGGSLYLFFQGPINWRLTPSLSREVNKTCFLLDFYDQHDVWHMVSAVSMFFSFMTMFTLDDDLLNTPRDQIPVF